MRGSTGKLATAALVAGTMTIAGCSIGGGSADDGVIDFQMHWSWSASTAGFAVAEADGMYDDAGVDVSIEQGKGSGTAVQLVTSGQSDVGIADAVAITQQIEQGAPLVIVATINQVTNIAMQALDSSGIETVEDIKGKTVAIPQGGAYSFVFPLFLQLNGLTEQDVTISNVPAESTVPSLLAGNVDAIIGGPDTHVALAQQGAEFKDFLFADHGVSAVAHSIFTTERFLEENQDEVKRFVAASLEGWNSTLDDPEHAIAAVKELQPDTVEETVRVELEFLFPLMCAGDAEYVGRAERDHWEKSMDLLVRADLVPEGLDISKSVSYDALPPESELRRCN